MEIRTQFLVAKEGEVEPLPLVLRALITSDGTVPSYDAVNAALGLSVTPVAVKAVDDLSRWPAYGRDFHLAPVASMLGLHLRHLHPPDVGLDMSRADEFDQHFELSYRPLIQRALENDQPVIAWRGWEDETLPSWGVVTGMSGRMFTGCMAGTGKTYVLTGSAWQCYVVERQEKTAVDEVDLATAALRHADTMLQVGMLQAEAGRAVGDVLLGDAAHLHWRGWLETSDPKQSDVNLNRCRRYAEFLSHGRMSAKRFWGEIAGRLPSEYLPMEPEEAETLASACEEGWMYSQEIVRTLDALSGRGPEETLAMILPKLDELREGESKVRSCIRELAGRLKS